jgi:hypothetical protein
VPEDQDQFQINEAGSPDDSEMLHRIQSLKDAVRRGQNYGLFATSAASPEETQDEDPLAPLTKKQRRRALALQESRSALVGYSSTAPVEPTALVYVATYIEAGWDLGAVQEVEDEAAAAVQQGYDLTPHEDDDEMVKGLKTALAADRAHEAVSIIEDAASQGLGPDDSCPTDDSHKVGAHYPGGAWFGTTLNHRPRGKRNLTGYYRG